MKRAQNPRHVAHNGLTVDSFSRPSATVGLILFSIAFPLLRRSRGWFGNLVRMRKLVGVGSDLGPALLFQTGAKRLDVVIDDGRLNKDDQFVSLTIVCLVFESVPQIRDVH